MRIVIVGAGTFGASLAWQLAGRGDEVVLVDQFEPGDRRATSGGETRLIRSAHGADADYTAMARRAWTLWRELEQESGATLLTQTGVCWFAHAKNGWEAKSRRTLNKLKIPNERWSVADTAKRFPSFAGDDLEWVLYEPEAGVLRAQKAVQTLVQQAQAHGATLVQGRAIPDGDYAIVNGKGYEGDRVVWASGGWLRQLFPDLIQLRVTLQELFFYDGGPAWRNAPAWIDYDRAVYGTNDLDQLGVKVAWDHEGPPIEPDADLPPATPETRSPRPRLRGRPLPRARGGAAGRQYHLPLRALRRQPLHRRAAPGAPVGVARRRRLRPRLQARPGAGRAARHRLGRRRAAAGALRPRRARQGPVVQERGLELLTATNHGPSCSTSPPPSSSASPAPVNQRL